MNNQWIDAWIGLNREQVAFAQNIAQGLSSMDMHWNPAPGSWSIAQCLHHKAITIKLYAQGIDRLLAKAVRTDPTTAPYSPGWIAKKVIAVASPGGKRGLRAPKLFTPSEDPPTDGLEDFLHWQEWLVNRMGAARMLDLNRPKLRSPALPLVRFSLGETFEMMLGHNFRHLNQALAVRSHPEFPGEALASCG